MEIRRLDLAKPLMAQLELTHSCNHRCAHCYRLGPYSSNIQDKVDEKTILSVAQKLADAEIFNVVVTGGEPLLKPDLAKKVISLLQEHDVQVGLNSNITLLSDDFLEYIKEHNVNILTSCPSSSQDKFNQMVGVEKYDIFCERLVKIIESGAHCTVNMVVTKDNLDEIRTTALFLNKLGCQSFSATPMFLNMDSPQKDLLLSREEVMKVVEDIIWVKSKLNMFVDILESLPKCVFSPSVRNSSYSFLNRKCQAGRTVIGVSPNGDIRPCSTNTISYGNILREDIRDIWKKMEAWRSTEYFPSKCKECSWVDRCNAGCRINSKAYWGKWNSPEIWSGEPITESPESDYKQYQLAQNTKIRFNNNFSYREEYNGIFVIFNKMDESFVMINDDLFKFIISLEDATFATIGELATAYNMNLSDKNFNETINLLINKKILEYEI